MPVKLLDVEADRFLVSLDGDSNSDWPGTCERRAAGPGFVGADGPFW
ncbi:MAG TPA: hypothetical protein VLJ88_04945 [Propionibacteriaceae bacterium]|nr:hypothetical protein [Propionibacteriaceae bacterium]